MKVDAENYVVAETPRPSAIAANNVGGTTYSTILCD
jgi:hypothetical protein